MLLYTFSTHIAEAVAYGEQSLAIARALDLREQVALTLNDLARRIARQLHAEDALPLFAGALRDPSPEVWKAALDGLVDLASPASLLLLQEAVERDAPGSTASSEWQAWVREALQQARAEFEARGGVA